MSLGLLQNLADDDLPVLGADDMPDIAAVMLIIILSHTDHLRGVDGARHACASQPTRVAPGVLSTTPRAAGTVRRRHRIEPNMRKCGIWRAIGGVLFVAVFVND